MHLHKPQHYFWWLNNLLTWVHLHNPHHHTWPSSLLFWGEWGLRGIAYCRSLILYCRWSTLKCSWKHFQSKRDPGYYWDLSQMLLWNLLWWHKKHTCCSQESSKEISMDPEHTRSMPLDELACEGHLHNPLLPARNYAWDICCKLC
jgi:hypothetical protein